MYRSVVVSVLSDGSRGDVGGETGRLGRDDVSRSSTVRGDPLYSRVLVTSVKRRVLYHRYVNLIIEILVEFP